MDRDFKPSGSSKIKRNCELKCRNWFRVYLWNRFGKFYESGTVINTTLIQGSLNDVI